MSDERWHDERLDDGEEEQVLGTRGFWAAFEQEAARQRDAPAVADVGALKERLKRRARERARRPDDA